MNTYLTLKLIRWVCVGLAIFPALVQAEPSGIIPRYLLAGPSGQAISEDDFRGRFQLITFGYTFCPDICPTTLAEMTQVLRSLPVADAEKLRLIFITVDPERDTPSVLKTYTTFFDTRIVGLSGSPELVSRAARNFKVRYAKVNPVGSSAEHYSVDHSAGMFLLGPDGQFIKKFPYGKPLNELQAEVLQFIQAH
ncbi:MAG: hypothetical protein RIR18_848 [Pseudomonadota bacterium]|jgi:protein SCO1/2